MQTDDLRVSLFSGNYNYVRDGANQALNRLVEYLLRRGAKVRVYSPTIKNPAFEATGDLVSIPSFAIPGREEYRFPMAITSRVKTDLAKFAPNIVHTSSPDLVGHRAVTWARHNDIPILSSVHTRFDTYARYYGMAFLEPLMIRLLRRYYQRCNAIVAPSESMAQILRDQNMNDDIGIWSRGVDRDIFDPTQRSNIWRQSLGIKDDDIVIGFLGRLVMEKGLDIFAQSIERLKQIHHSNTRKNAVNYKILIIGQGPAQDWLQKKMADAIFAGFQSGRDLGRAVASMDILFNPSITETFGNVTLEAMACGVPVVAARAAGSQSLVDDGVTGILTAPNDADEFAQGLQKYMDSATLRRQHGHAGELKSRAYSWDIINQSVVDSYLRIIESHHAMK